MIACIAAGRGLYRLAPLACAVSVAAAMAGCTNAPGRAAPAAAAPLPASADPYVDWHGLIAAPLDSTLKDLPFAVHELLQFSEETRAAGEPSGGEECYRPGQGTPRFVDRELDDYVLCYRRDRLARIEADLHVETADADALFARYCDAWLENSTLVARDGANCRGRAGQIAFDARLDEDRGESTTSMSMIISKDPDSMP